MSENPFVEWQHYIIAAAVGVVGVVTGAKYKEGKNDARLDAIHDDLKDVKQDVREIRSRVDDLVDRR